ncbi:hypothetical protein [Endozoicomonas lisbonensis]|uniref:Uncharacterized protein n=1 Tax=Endozoicomonas lisbonensis TaxID=3120522 RepID=A0ABV2SDI1_9GAMM
MSIPSDPSRGSLSPAPDSSGQQAEDETASTSGSVARMDVPTEMPSTSSDDTSQEGALALRTVRYFPPRREVESPVKSVWPDIFFALHPDRLILPDFSRHIFNERIRTGPEDAYFEGVSHFMMWEIRKALDCFLRGAEAGEPRCWNNVGVLIDVFPALQSESPYDTADCLRNALECSPADTRSPHRNFCPYPEYHYNKAAIANHYGDKILGCKHYRKAAYLGSKSACQALGDMDDRLGRKVFYFLGSRYGCDLNTRKWKQLEFDDREELQSLFLFLEKGHAELDISTFAGHFYDEFLQACFGRYETSKKIMEPYKQKLEILLEERQLSDDLAVKEQKAGKKRASFASPLEQDGRQRSDETDIQSNSVGKSG